ncbi:uncharacterized protein RHO17_018362 [Thomomys bottae]
MAAQNHTGESPFLLLGLSDDPQLQPILFELFLSMYLITVLGNLLIILAVTSDPHLHTPMYFFLSNLSFVDISFTSTTVPKMLVDIQTQRKDISYPECLTQVYFFMIFVGMDNFLLTVMAYDRFVAICHPLNYPVIMNPHFCGLLVLVSWLLIFCISLHHILMMRKLTFSLGTTIPHFFCELAQVLQVASSDTLINDIWMYLDFVLFCVFPALGIFFSYHQILSSLMKLPNMASKHKAFSTCGSQLCMVSLFYGIGLGVYLSSSVSSSAHRSKVASVMYTVVPPMLNPFIYSLRNQDVMGALERLPGRVVSCLDGLGASSIHSPYLCYTESWDSATSYGNIKEMLHGDSAGCLQSHSRAISYGGCLTQISLLITFACTDSMLLTAMAYDCFVAICHPLHYSCIMNPRLHVSLFGVSFTLRLLESLLHNLIVLQLTCFRTVDIANFFCHPSQLLHLACTDSFSNEIVMCVIGILLGVLPASGILFSYCQILSSILKIPSAAGKYKAFSTCGSHLSVVSLSYGTGLVEYFGSALSTSPRNHVVASMMYAVVTPLLNPFIYSLRNRDISRALERFDTRAFSVFAPAASRGSAVSSAMYTVVTLLLNPFIYSLRNNDLKSALSRLYKPRADNSRWTL